MKSKKFNSRIDMLNDSIAYYWGASKRKCIVDGGCLYTPVSKDTEGCAIGRLLPKKLCKKLDKNLNIMDGTGVDNSLIFDQLPQWMKDLGQGFLVQVQLLHDRDYFVNKNKRGIESRISTFVEVNQIVFPD